MGEAALTTTQSRTGADLERTLVRTQLFAGALFAMFVLLHLSNVLVAPLGIEVFNTYQQTIRPIYQFPLVELFVVIGPLLVHATSGVWLAVLRRGRHGKRALRARFHTWAGFFLLIVIGGHVLATRGASFFYGVFPEFEGLAFSIWYAPWYFYPYYFLLAVAGFYHASNGLMLVGSRFGLRIPKRVQLVATGVVAVGVTLSLLAFGGHYFETPDPVKNDFAELGRTLFGFEY